MIKLKKTESIRFFKKVGNVAEVLGITSQAVSNWGEYVPPGRAEALFRISKLHKYRRRGKLKVEFK